MTNIKNLNDILTSYKDHVESKYPSKKAQEILTQTETAINRYTLPGFGHEPPKGRKPTKAENQAAVQFRGRITTEQFANALEAQEKAFEVLQPSKSSRYVYSSRLKELLNWSEQEPWWLGSSSSTSKNNCCSQPRQRGYGGVNTTRVVDRPRLDSYGLTAEQISASLEAEMEEFFRFRTQKNYPHRLEEPLDVEACRDAIGLLYHILGWFYNFKGIPLEDLNSSLLVPKVALRSATDLETAKTLAEEKADYVDSWVCEFCEFLEEEREAKSPHTRKNYLFAVLAIAKFQYLREKQDPDYRDVPVIERVLRRRITLVTKELQNHEPIADQELKWMELPQVLAEIVEPLRGECQPLLACGSSRSLSAIASSFQRFVIWGNLTYMPPRRQKEIRNLKLALSCPVERPQGVPPDGLIHPLPQGRKRERKHGYLYRTVEGKWIRDMNPESYKTGKTYGHQELEIPNVQYADGKCFYDYLEMWLYGYYKASDGSLQSCGATFNPQETTIKRWYPGRMIRDIDHDFVFMQPKNGNPFTSSSLARNFSSAAHALTGKRVTPHLLRDIYATYFLDQGYSDATIASLAYAMAHSPEMLRKIYDRRRPNDKRRPIQKAVLEIVQQSLGMGGQPSLEALSAKEQILALLPQLTLEERQQIKLAL